MIELLKLLLEYLLSGSGVGSCTSSYGLSHLGPREGRSQACLSPVPVAVQNIRKKIVQRRSEGNIVSICECVFTYCKPCEGMAWVMGNQSPITMSVRQSPPPCTLFSPPVPFLARWRLSNNKCPFKFLELNKTIFIFGAKVWHRLCGVGVWNYCMSSLMLHLYSK